MASPGFDTWTEIDDGGLAYMDINQDEVFVFKSGTSRFMFNGDFKKRFGKEIPIPQGDFIFYQHQGKPYLIQDPSIVAKARSLLAPLKDGRLREAEEARDRRDRELHQRLQQLNRVESRLTNPEFQAAMDEMSKTLEQLKSQTLTAQSGQNTLPSLQTQLARIQDKLGELQAKIAMQSESFEIQDQDEALAAEHERLGGTTQSIINDAQRELKPLIEQAIKDGRVKPLN